MNRLPEAQAEALLRQAEVVARNSYTPYSQFPVGAALLCEDGQVITGCNVENASFGLTQCAERTALCTAIAAGKRIFTALAVWAANTEGHAVTPCGACRQVIAELLPPEGILVMRTPDGGVTQKPVSWLLPGLFKL